MTDKRINLRDLFTLDERLLPNWVIKGKYFVYRIINLIDGKSYIGQTKDMYDRIFGHVGHLTCYTDYCTCGYDFSELYSALREFKSRNFEFYVLEELPDSSMLFEREMYYIKYYHTCILDKECNGYNMNYGGKDVTHMHNVAAIRNRIIGLKEYYGDKYEEELKKLEGLSNIHIDEGDVTKVYKMYGIDLFSVMGRKGAEIAIEVERANGTGFFDSELQRSLANRYYERIFSDDKLYEDLCKRRSEAALKLYSSLSYEERCKMRRPTRVTKLFDSIYENLKRIKDRNLPLNEDSYKYVNGNYVRHICRVGDCYDDLILDSRWTVEIDNLLTPLLKKENLI